MMQMIGVDFETIRFASGHAGIDMTRHYLYVQAPKQLDAAQRFSDVFSINTRKFKGEYPAAGCNYDISNPVYSEHK